MDEEKLKQEFERLFVIYTEDLGEQFNCLAEPQKVFSWFADRIARETAKARLEGIKKCKSAVYGSFVVSDATRLAIVREINAAEAELERTVREKEKGVKDGNRNSVP